jgi:putative two-component system response regulator
MEQPAMSVFNVLIVDDDPHQRAILRDTLDTGEFQVTEAGSGLEAIHLLATREFDAVLLDKKMPEMDGDEVCRRIRSELGLTMLPIVMVTGNGDIANFQESMAVGATDFVRKPYVPTELLVRVRSAAQRKRMTDELDNAETLLFALARMVEAKDGTTGDHCSRLSHYGVVLGRALGLSIPQLHALRRGGVLHDIGKLGIPDSILLKPGALTETEWTVMRQHVNIGASIVGELKSMRLAEDIVKYHHERWDGTGYPDGLKGEQIPLLARVFQIVDTYDALSHARPYKRAFTQSEVIDILLDETRQGFRDPHIVAVFVDILQNSPEDLMLSRHQQDDLGLALFSDIEKTKVLEWNMSHAA